MALALVAGACGAEDLATEPIRADTTSSTTASAPETTAPPTTEIAAITASLEEWRSVHASESVVAVSFADGSTEIVGDDRVRPWASITKQILAVVVLQLVDEGRLRLDDPIDRHLTGVGAGPIPTVEDLLRHRSGLRNSDDGPTDDRGFPAIYSSGRLDADWCLTDRGEPRLGGVRYNNCDFVVLGEVVASVTGSPTAEVVRTRILDPIGMSRTAVITVQEDVAGAVDEDERRTIAGYGASADLAGTASDLLRFDRALLDGELLSDVGRARLWDADPALASVALGQWVYDVSPCGEHVRLVERRGAIGRHRATNLLLPEFGMAAAVITGGGEDLGEPWTGTGPATELLAILCEAATDT